MTACLAGRGLRALRACFALGLLSLPAWAGGEPPRLIAFSLQAQPLAQALAKYSLVSGMTVLVDSALTAGRQAPAVIGNYTAGDALSRLLAGSALSIRYASPYSFTLVADAKATPRADGSRLRETGYAAALQAALRRVLCAGAATAPGPYRAVVQLWMDGNARVRRVGWITGSGSAVRDRALEQALDGLSAGPLPTGLAQPITVLLTPGNVTECGLAQGGAHG